MPAWGIHSKRDIKQLINQYSILLQLLLFLGRKYTGFIWTEKKKKFTEGLWTDLRFTESFHEDPQMVAYAWLLKGKRMEEDENKYKLRE